MREYILTEKEREEIIRFLHDKKMTNLLYVLKSRSLRVVNNLEQDLELIKDLIK